MSPIGVLELRPATNYAVANPGERADQMAALARVLMGLSYPLQLCAQARERSGFDDWTTPPRLTRRWLAVVRAEDNDQLAWRMGKLRSSLEGVGLRTDDELPGDCRVDRVSAIFPSCVRIGPDRESLAASLVLRRWPREVAPGWLGQALASDLPVDVAVHIEPQDPQWIARKLKHQQTWQNTDDAADQLGSRDARQMREDLIARRDRPVKVAVVFTVRARDRAQLKRRVEALQHEVGLAIADARLAKYEQDLGFEATEPNGICRLSDAWQTLDCTSVASMWLFQPSTVDHVNGAPIGTTHDGTMLVRLDPFDDALESFGGIVLAKVGAGKSYFLKLLARRLKGVEILIVEQRNPAEYTGVPNARSFNLADVPYSERADRLRTFVSDLWEVAKLEPRPRLLILDELWSLLRDPSLAALIEEIARIGRHHYLSLWIATQQVQELLSSDQGLAVLNNAAIKVYLKQRGPDGELLAKKAQLSGEAWQFLRGAARGQALLDVDDMLVPVDIQASKEENRLITTDPREKHNGVTRPESDSPGGSNGHVAHVPAWPQDTRLDRYGGSGVVVATRVRKPAEE